MKKLIPLFLSSVLLVSVGACNNAKTASDAPNNPNNAGNAPSATNAQNTQNDATSDTRKKQLESDIRAREQRNKVAGDQTKRADGDLESEVRSKLEANLTASKLTVDAKDGDLTIGGTVRSKRQLAQVAPLAKEIKGVKNVTVKATVAPAQ